MSSILEVSAVRARIEAQLTEELGGENWTASKLVYEMFGRDTQKLQHLAFAVGVPRTLVRDSVVESSVTRRGGLGGQVATEARVRWAYRVRGDAQVSDYDAALDAEQALVLALLGTDRDSMSIALTDMTRQVLGDGTYVVGDVGLLVQHRIRLV